MDLHLLPEDQEFRNEVRDWLSSHVPDGMPPLDSEDGFAAHRAWERTLYDARLAAVSWPEEYGGRGASLVQWLIFEEEYYRQQAPVRVSQNGLFLLAPTIFEHGTPEQRERILPRMARADDVWAQAWSEPEAGSDLAAISSTAVQSDDGWMLNGRKIWSTRAPFADWCFGLFRSEPGSKRHHGLTYFMADLRGPGVSVRPIRQLDGEPSFGEIVFDDVLVPQDQVLGEVGGGWAVAMTTASSERGLSLRSPGRFLASTDRLVDLARHLETDPRSHDAARVADAWMRAEAYRLATFRTVSRMNRGQKLGSEMSMSKVFWSEMDIDANRVARDLIQSEAQLAAPAPGFADVAAWTSEWLFALPGPIWGGSNEVQRTIIAERVLGLPRGR